MPPATAHFFDSTLFTAKFIGNVIPTVSLFKKFLVSIIYRIPASSLIPLLTLFWTISHMTMLFFNGTDSIQYYLVS